MVERTAFICPLAPLYEAEASHVTFVFVPAMAINRHVPAQRVFGVFCTRILHEPPRSISETVKL